MLKNLYYSFVVGFLTVVFLRVNLIYRFNFGFSVNLCLFIIQTLVVYAMATYFLFFFDLWKKEFFLPFVLGGWVARLMISD